MTRYAVSFLVLAFVVAACTNDPEASPTAPPATDPPAAATASPSDTPSAFAPTKAPELTPEASLPKTDSVSPPPGDAAAAIADNVSCSLGGSSNEPLVFFGDFQGGATCLGAQGVYTDGPDTWDCSLLPVANSAQFQSGGSSWQAGAQGEGAEAVFQVCV